MKRIYKIIFELLIFFIFVIIYLFFYNDFLLKDFLEILNFYFIGRIIFNLIILSIRYNFFSNGKNNKVTKELFESKIYAHLSLIFLFLSFYKFLRFTFIILFIIFGLLYFLSKVSWCLTHNKKNSLERNFEKDEANTYTKKKDDLNEEVKTYNLFCVNYNSMECYQLLEIICNNTLGILDNFFKSSFITILEKLFRTNYLFLVQRSMYFGDLDIFCGIINSYLKRLDINIKISKDDVAKYDSKEMIERRSCFKSTFYNDLKIIDRILSKNRLHLVAIGFYENNNKFLSLGIVTDDIYKKLEKKFQLYN